jgi:site-specific DNA-methyltransferase (adenine-specific)
VTPYYQDEAVCIYHADCREVLPFLGTVQGIVTDPPFGIGFEYESHDDTPDGYGAFVWSAIELSERLCEPGSPVFVWQAMPNIRRLHEWFPREWRIFAACKNFVQMRPVSMQYAFDPVVVWWTPGAKPWSAGTSTRDFHIGNTSGVIGRKTHEKAHPCPRPLNQLEHIVSQWVRPGGIVLDPFMGSGTTLVAAKRLGRKAIGIEREKKYCDLAIERLAQGALGLEVSA